MKRGDRVSLRCVALDERGAAIAPHAQDVIHVPGALPDELVEAVVDHVSPHRRDGRGEAWANLTAVHTPSPARVSPVCPGYGPCGGCPLQHLNYPAQVAWKTQRAREQLAGVPGVTVEDCVPSPRSVGYRNQGKYVYGRTRTGQRVLGAYAPRSHEVVDQAGCQVVEPAVDAAARHVRARLEAHDVTPFDERTRTGSLRYVMVRANAAGQVLVTLVAARAGWPAADAIAAELLGHAGITGVVLNVNDDAGNVLFGAEERALAGSPTLDDRIGEARVELASRSFFQVNRDVAALAYAEIVDAVRGLGRVSRTIDAYAGAGGIAFSLYSVADEVVAIEENAAATGAAAAQAERLGLDRVRFLTGDASTLIATVGRADVVVLNPPRAGCAAPVLAATTQAQPRLVAYLSCNPSTLARDLKVLVSAGFAVSRVIPYDMLPHTPHVEMLALLTCPK